MVLLLLGAMLLLAGCDAAVDVPSDDSAPHPSGFNVGPIGSGPQAAAVDLSSAVSVAPDGRLYGCVLSAHPEGDTLGPYQYRYAQLAFPEAVTAKALGEQRLTYRLRTEDGVVLRQATCLIPATTEARDLVLDWVGLPETGDGWSSGSSTGSNPKDPTPILYYDPVECHNEPLEDMKCSIDQAVVSEEAIDDGGGGGGGWWDPIPPDSGWSAPWDDNPGEGPGSGSDDNDDENEDDCGDSADDGAPGGGETAPPPPTGGEEPCGAACYDPPTDDGSGGGDVDGPHDAPGFMVGATWHVVTSSGLIVAPYDPTGHALYNGGCDPEPPCESDNPPEHCDEAGSCFDAEIEDEEAAAILRDLEAASVLGNLRDNSNFDAPLQSARLEQGGWIVQTADGYGLEPFPSNWVRTACAILPVTPPGGVSIPENAVGMIHTHPFEKGEPLETCGDPLYTTPDGTDLYETYDNTPSEADILTIQSLQNAGYDIDGYVIDKDKVIAYDGATLLGPGSPNPPVKVDRCGY